MGRLCWAGLMLAFGAAQAQAPSGSGYEQRLRELPMALEMRWDPVHIRAHDGESRERMGLLGTGLLFELEPGWWMGPVAIGAASGQRGGFFALGAQVQRRWQLAEQWRAQLGLTAGGGGGAGAPVGGGLLVQPAASLMYDWGTVQTGLSWSRVNMPSGQIGSQQWGLVLSWDGRMRYFDVGAIGDTSPYAGRTGLGFDRVMLSTTQLRVNAHGDVPSASVRLMGVRADHHTSEIGYWGIEAAAATQGGADGYMEVLGTIGLEAPLVSWGLPSVSVGVRGALGLGGGGAVRTGGGSLGKVATSLRLDVGRDAFVGVEAGVVRSGSGDHKARYAQALIGLQLDHPESFAMAHVGGMAWSASVQHLSHAARKDGRSQALDTVGLKVQQDIGALFYLTGQAQSAFAGQAGAFSMGMAGVGWSTANAGQVSPGWQFSAELLAGAAGGGGVDTNGGAVGQGMAYLGYALRGGSEVQVGLGRIRSLHGGLNSPVIDLSWTQHLGVSSR